MKAKSAVASQVSALLSGASVLPPIRFKVSRAFKALDNGVHRKWVIVANARDLPLSLPLDANARIPNVVKNKHCREMRKTLIENPELWQILNSGIVCTATAVEVRQDGDSHLIEIVFEDGSQGIVNGGHSYAQLIHFLHGNTNYSSGKELKEILMKDAREDGFEALSDIILNDEHFDEMIAKARDTATVQMEFVAPVGDSALLTRIARARNLSQGVEDTAFQNLAGRFELMKEVLRSAPAPFGPGFVERVVWKTNQEVPEDSRAIAVKTIVQVLALMNTRQYPPATKSSNEVYVRSGLVVREFGETEGEDLAHYEKLQRLLPTLLKLYDHVYFSLSDADPRFPWVDGKLDLEKPKKTTGVTPFLGKLCTSKVASAFVWPIFSAMRALIVEDGPGLKFAEDPFEIFDDLKQDFVSKIEGFHTNQAHGLTTQVGRDKEIWVRLDNLVENELKMRQKLASMKKK